MSRIDFGWCIFENVEELLLSVFLRAWARACIRILYSCVYSSVLACAGVFLRLCVCGNGPACTGSCLCMWVLTCVRETFGKSPTLPIFTFFSSVLLLYTILTHLFVIFAPEYHCILFFRPCVRHSAGSRYVGEEVLHWNHPLLWLGVRLHVPPTED